MATHQPPMKTFKIVVIGESASGKTTYLTRLLTGEFLTTHQPTLGVQVDPYRINTTRGRACMNFWDCAGADQYASLGPGYYHGADGALIMFDLNQPNPIPSINYWIHRFRQVCPQAPIVVVGTKYDQHSTWINERTIAEWLHRGPFEQGIRYYSMSSRSNFNLMRPVLELLQMLMGSALRLVENEPVQPPVATIPPDQERQLLADLVANDIRDRSLDHLRQVQAYLQSLS